MSEIRNLIVESFFSYFQMMVDAIRILFPPHNETGIILPVYLPLFILAILLVFLCNWIERKYNLGFATGLILRVAVLNAPVGLIEFLMSLLRVDLVTYPLLVKGITSSILTILLAVIASLGNLLKTKFPIMGTVLLFGVGILLAWVFITTFLIFVLRLYN